MYFDQLSFFPIMLLLFLLTLLLCHIQLFECLIFFNTITPLGCQTVWIQIRCPNINTGLVCDFPGIKTNIAKKLCIFSGGGGWRMCLTVYLIL